MQDFRQLRVWQKAHEVALAVYRETAAFPSDERFGLTAQLRRAAVSVGSNIAEGRGRGTDADFARFVEIALGSAFEVESQLLLARDLGFLAASRHDALSGPVSELKRMLTTFRARLRGELPVASSDDLDELGPELTADG